MVLLLGGLGGRFGDQHRDALPVVSEVPRGAAEFADPHAGFFRDEAIALHGIADGHQLVAGTVHQLERIFLVDRLPPWHRTRLSRLVKTSKLHMGDTGLACALLGIDAIALSGARERLGPMLETFVLQELGRQASWHTDPVDFFTIETATISKSTSCSNAAASQSPASR